MNSKEISVKTAVAANPDFSCSLCCVDKPDSSRTCLTKCSHESCRECLSKWIEKLETSGQSTLPGCPFCRLEMTQEEVFVILERPFQPRTSSSQTSDADDLDDLTREWLQEQTQMCPGCGACIEKEDGTCNLMECLCGFRFCYHCGAQGAQCSCTPSHHFFWDNCFDRQAGRLAPPTATPDQETGMVDLQKHITKRKREEHARSVRAERTYLRRLARQEVRDQTDLSAQWMFCTRGRESSIRVLNQIENWETVHFARLVSNGEEVEEDEEIIGVGAGKWLYSTGTVDGGFTHLSEQYSPPAVRMRERRLKSRAYKRQELTGVDAAFASGKWLYYCRDMASTYRQVKRYSNHQKNETKMQFTEWYFCTDSELCCCGEFGCEICSEDEHRAVYYRLFFLDEKDKATEINEISQHGL